MIIKAGTPTASRVEKVILNGKTDPSHYWSEVNLKTQTGIRLVTKNGSIVLTDSKDRAQTEEVSGAFEIIWKPL